MSKNEKMSIALKSLLGLYGFNSFIAITYEIGKIILPAALLIGGIAFLGSSIGNDINFKNVLIGFVLMGGANFLLNLFSNERSSLIKLPIDELFNQFKLSSCNELRFIHFKERQRIVVYFDGNCNFVLGECDSEHLVSDYMDYIKSESVYSKNGKMENMKPEMFIDQREEDTAIIAKFTRNAAAR